MRANVRASAYVFKSQGNMAFNAISGLHKKRNPAGLLGGICPVLVINRTLSLKAEFTFGDLRFHTEFWLSAVDLLKNGRF